MGHKTIKLISLLDQSSNFLARHGEANWSECLLKSKLLLEAGNFSGVPLLLGAYGGMGSFNDLILSPINGHTLCDQETDKVNIKLNKYRSELYDLANQIKREAIFDK
jgi:hypothetical protein